MKKFLAMIVLATSLMSGCGGGGGGGSTPGTSATIYGVAAAGAPIVGTVNIRGANGKVSMSAISSDGSFTVDVTALTSPFVIYAEGKAGSSSARLYSIVDTAGRANVTPATNIIIAKALGKSPEEAFPPSSMKTEGGSIDAVPTNEEIEAAKQAVLDILKNVFSSVGVAADFDLMNGVFTANASGFDKLLDLVDMKVTGNSVEIKDPVTGTTFYNEDVSTGTISVNNGSGLATAISTSATIHNALLTNFNTWLAIYSTDGLTNAEIEAIVNPLIATDSFSDGMDGAEALQQIKDEYNDPDTREEISGFEVTGFKILGSYNDIDFAGGTVTLGGVSHTVGGATFYSGKEILACEITLNISGTNYSFTNFYIKEGGVWRDFGNQSPFDEDGEMNIFAMHEYRNRKGITGFDSGIMINVNDLGNVAFNNDVDALIVIGDGIKTKYAGTNKGLILLKKEITSTQYVLKNVALPADINHVFYDENDKNIYLTGDTDGLVIAEMNNPVYKIIGCKLTGTTLTPKRLWLQTLSARPDSKVAGELLEAHLPKITSPTSLVPFAFPGNITVSWNPPTGAVYPDIWFVGTSFAWGPDYKELEYEPTSNNITSHVFTETGTYGTIVAGHAVIMYGDQFGRIFYGTWRSW